MVGGGERTARDAGPSLERVGVAVRRAVLQDQLPGERRGGKRPLLRVGWRSPTKEIRSPTFQVVPAAGASIVAVGGVLFAEIVDRRARRRWFRRR